jgi:hypothetical protein
MSEELKAILEIDYEGGQGERVRCRENVYEYQEVDDVIEEVKKKLAAMGVTGAYIETINPHK